MTTSQIANRICGVLTTAQDDKNEIRLSAEVSNWLINEMHLLADDILHLEKATIADDVRAMPEPSGQNIVSLSTFKATRQQRNQK